MTRRARRDGAGSSRRRRGRIISRPFLNSITSACPATFGSKQSTSELNDSLESRNAFISLISARFLNKKGCFDILYRSVMPISPSMLVSLCSTFNDDFKRTFCCASEFTIALLKLVNPMILGIREKILFCQWLLLGNRPVRQYPLPYSRSGCPLFGFPSASRSVDTSCNVPGTVTTRRFFASSAVTLAAYNLIVVR